MTDKEKLKTIAKKLDFEPDGWGEEELFGAMIKTIKIYKERNDELQNIKHAIEIIKAL